MLSFQKKRELPALPPACCGRERAMSISRKVSFFVKVLNYPAACCQQLGIACEAGAPYGDL